MTKRSSCIVLLPFLLLVACKGTSTADVMETDEVRDIEDCIEGRGLVVESEYLKCVTEEGEFPLGRPVAETREEPGTEDWSEEPFFAALADLGQPLDFQWDMDLPVMGEHGKSVVMEEEIVFFFRFASAEDAKEEILVLQRDGVTRKGMRVYWGEGAQYVQKGAVVAVYTGSHEKVMELLEKAAS